MENTRGDLRVRDDQENDQGVMPDLEGAAHEMPAGNLIRKTEAPDL